MLKKIILLVVLSFMLSLVAAATAQAEKIKIFGDSEVDELIQNLMLGEPVYYKNLTIIPIYSTKIRDASRYLTLDEAIRKGFVTITEVNGGTVPKVRVDNNSNHTIFFLSGEILIGGRQDRFVGEDLLLSPWRRGVTLPVYCSERGRWTVTSDKFESEGIIAAPSLRQKILEKKEQTEIWDGIRKESERLGASSKTEAFRDVYRDENVEKEMASYLKRFESVPLLHKNTIGVAVGVRGRIVAIDIFSNPDLFARLWPKLLKSYALSAFGPEPPAVWVDLRNETKELLKRVYRARENRYSAIDLGETLKINADGITATALVYRRGVVHLSVLPPNFVLFGKDDVEPLPVPPNTIPVLE